MTLLDDDAFLCMRAKALLGDLEARLARFQDAVQRCSSPAWVWDGSRVFEHQAARSLATEIIGQLWFDDDRDGRETPKLCGAVAIPSSMGASITGINSIKQELQRCLIALGLRSRSLAQEALHGRGAVVRQEMANLGMGRLSRKSAYRPLRFFDEPPATLSFGLASMSKSIRVMTVDQAQEALLALGSADVPHIGIQLARLAELGSQEALAQVQSQAPHFKANGVYVRECAGERHTERLTLDAALPFFVAASSTFPECRVAESRTRRRRKDRLIEDVPFLPSIRVHRYLQSGDN